MAKTFFLVFLCLVLFSGCFNLRGIFTLKKYSGSQAVITKDVHMADKRFALLVRDHQRGAIGLGTDKASILRRYGEPILSANVQYDGGAVSRLLYRRQSAYFGAHKIYLYFDYAGKLIFIEEVNARSNAAK